MTRMTSETTKTTWIETTENVPNNADAPSRYCQETPSALSLRKRLWKRLAPALRVLLQIVLAVQILLGVLPGGGCTA